ncbi:MAG: ABC transporter ATP-binding protein [Lysobacterales bacterium]|jgi:putative ABC transport system ATP-binding protein
MLQLINIHKSFHDGESDLQVLAGIDLDLKPGESLALLGSSGSGKSTLLQIAAGLELPDAGEVRMKGANLVSMDEPDLARLRRKDLGFVFQSFNLLSGLNVRDNVLFQRRLNRMPDRDGWVAELLAGLQLEAIEHRPVEVLSGGQQQRVAIARALAHRPQLVFADEPTGNLHDSLSRQVMALFIRLVEEAGSALFLVTHNRDMAAMTDRQFRLSRGCLGPDV